jgi:thiol-disulfide isomerase/thioredoxin
MKVIKIGAVWCNGCLVMRPRWQEIEAENKKLQTEYLDFDQDQDKVALYNIEGSKLPICIFIDSKGNELERLQGEVDKTTLIDKISQYQDK